MSAVQKEFFSHESKYFFGNLIFFFIVDFSLVIPYTNIAKRNT